jgi:hypothetical protein
MALLYLKSNKRYEKKEKSKKLSHPKYQLGEFLTTPSLDTLIMKVLRKKTIHKFQPLRGAKEGTTKKDLNKEQ